MTIGLTSECTTEYKVTVAVELDVLDSTRLTKIRVLARKDQSQLQGTNGQYWTHNDCSLSCDQLSSVDCTRPITESVSMVTSEWAINKWGQITSYKDDNQIFRHLASLEFRTTQIWQDLD